MLTTSLLTWHVLSLQKLLNFIKDTIDSAKYLLQGLSVTLSHMGRRPITVQYPYEKLIPSTQYRGRIHNTEEEYTMSLISA